MPPHGSLCIFCGKRIQEDAMLCVSLLPFPLTGGIFIFNNHATGKLKPLKFNIIDSPMGIGKSLSLMEFIRFHPRGKGEGATRFIVFVPTIKERDERFAKELDFKSPETPPYHKSITEMIRKGDNIVTTHALWSIFNDNTLRAFRESKYKYIACFDEVPPLFRDVVGAGRNLDSIVDIVRFGHEDVKLMQKENLLINENGELLYNAKCDYAKADKGYKIFNAVKKLSYSCTLYPYGDKDGLFTSIIAFQKRALFECFSQCWFFSYLTWKSMLYTYCHMFHIDMEYYQIVDRRIMRNPEGRYIATYPDGIENLVILDDKRFNMDENLSKAWYDRAGKDITQAGLKKLKRQFRNAYGFMKAHGVRSETFLFTVFTAYKDMLDSNGRYYPSLKRFLPCNTKATNDYSNCTGVAYLCNRYFDVTCVNFLKQRAKAENDPKLAFHNDVYALSELVQFIWRSNVRVKDAKQPVYVWVPDKRMRKLLKEFLQQAMKRKTEDMMLHLCRKERRITPAGKRKLARQLTRKYNPIIGYVRYRFFRFTVKDD